MLAKFKEKTYETAFMGELRLMTNHIFAPDQCDENILGFDGAAFIPWELFPDFIPFVRWRRWHRYTGLSSSDINQLGRELDTLPTFRLNLFIQFKRSYFLSRSNATEWASWDHAYYRYELDQHQLALMSKISESANGRAASVYAAAAFHANNNLFTHQISKSIITNSNISSAGLLKGHKVFTYDQPGNFGIGHSEPEEIESPSLESILDEYRDSEGMNFTAHVKETAIFLKETLQGDPSSKKTLELARMAYIGRGEEDSKIEGTWLDAIITIVAFSTAFNIRICAIA